MYVSPLSASVPASRIVSLVPSQTELLHSLGLKDEVVGITKFCIHPSHWYCNKLRVGGTKNFNIQLIKELKPDLVIANKEENLQEQVEALALEVPVWLTDVETREQALAMINDLGSLVNRKLQATALVAQIAIAFKNLAASARQPIQACYLIWQNPYMTVGHDTFISNMMTEAGFTNVFSHKTRYPIITADDIYQSGCKVLLLSSEPYPFKEKHIPALTELLPGIQILLVDGEMFSWYGSRMLLAPGYFKQLRKELCMSA